MRRRIAARALVLGSLILGALAPWSPGADAQVQQPPPVQFDARADLILVDANVLDDKGVPIGNLTAEEFVVSVDGQPRPIASVQFVRNDAPTEAPPAPAATHYSSNQGASLGRRILLAVDENSIAPGGARAALLSLERFLKSLSPADHVAFIRLPSFAGSVDFTTDRAKLATAIPKTIGQAHRVGFGRVSIAEAVSYERRDGFAWDRAIARICAGMSGIDLEVCQQDAESEATEMMSAYRRRARETLNGLAQIIANLRQISGPKTLVLLSQGFLGYEYRTETVRLAEAAAAARVSIYAMHIDMPSVDAADQLPSMTRTEDEQLMSSGIDDLAGASRGARFRIIGSGEGVFARVARELTGYYLIGLEPIESDRDGKPHRIKVEVKRPGTTVRARAQFTIAPLTAAEATRPPRPADRLVELLRAATPDGGVPLRLAAFTTATAAADKVKVIVTAEVGQPTDKPTTVQVGFLLVDANGKVAGSELSSVTLMPSDGAEPSPPRFLGNVEVPRGDYTLRLAVIDPDGRTGSVHHPVSARLREAAGVRISDLILAVPRGRTAARPEVHVSLEGQALQAALELAAADPRQLTDTQVSFDVTDKIDGAPIVQARGTIRGGDDTVKPAAALLDVGVLPPGSYIARAVVTVRGEKPITTARPFEIAPRRRRVAIADAPEAARATPRAAPRSRMRPPIPPFRTDDVLAPSVVNPFIDHVLENYSPSPSAREALTAIKAGDLQNATKGERQVGDLGMSFAQGLVLLAANRPAEADAYFRAALRSSSDFIGAAFYLGATLAAAGKDRDAVGAWQTALIGEVGAAGVYPVLIDGLLRLRDGEQALDILREAEPTFTNRDDYNRRLVQAYALLSRFGDALPIAHDYLSRHGDDTDMLFLTMHMIYEAHASGELANSPAELDRFRDYASKYAAAQGMQTPVVQGWRKALGIR